MKHKNGLTMTKIVVMSMLLLSASMPGMAQQTRANQLPTNLTGVTTTAVPAQDFDPRTASDQDLAYYGFPPRPDAVTAPEAFERWQRAMTGSRTRIVPNLQLTNVYNGPAVPVSGGITPSAGATSVENYIWSGYVNTNGATAYTASSLYAIAAEYVVPAAQQAFGTSACA